MVQTYQPSFKQSACISFPLSCNSRTSWDCTIEYIQFTHTGKSDMHGPFVLIISQMLMLLALASKSYSLHVVLNPAWCYLSTTPGWPRGNYASIEPTAYPGKTLAAHPLIMGSMCVPFTAWALVRYSGGLERHWELAQRFRSTLGISFTSCSRFLGGTDRRLR